MNYRSQLVCAWIGVVAVLLMFIGMWPLMHFLPPLDPALSVAEVAVIYRSNSTGILVGGLFLLAAASGVMPFFAALAMQLTRMETPSKLWTYTMLTSGILGFVPLLIAEMLFSTAAYRPERADDLIVLLNDFGFIMFVGPSLPGTVQMLASAIPVLTDRRAEPIFPRWVGYVSVWCALVATPGCLVTLFRKGPFAWNGVISFWVAAIAFGIWLNVNFWATRRAILRQRSHEDAYGRVTRGRKFAAAEA
jgi:hypothetical protein